MKIIIDGVAQTNLPKNLYIPPDALEVVLKSFSGPLDLLLYLIKVQNIDILNIPIASVTHQYMEYIRLMKIIKLELVAEYLLMAALLANIKSKMLLPKKKIDEEEEDPRAEIVAKLLEYEKIKKASVGLDDLPREERDYNLAYVDFVDKDKFVTYPQIKIDAVCGAFMDVLEQTKLNKHHNINKEQLSLRAAMSDVLEKLCPNTWTCFNDLFDVNQGVASVVITFLAILELIKEAVVRLQQSSYLEPIYVTKRAQ
jgi:segregation and condensation protein A